MRVVYAVLPSRQIFNLTSPRYLPEIVTTWIGESDYHADWYDPLRDIIAEAYYAAFDAHNGYFKRLEADILAHGFRNPVMLSAGGLLRRSPDELPEWVDPMQPVSEYLGGSRIAIAQKHDMDVPAIINHTGKHAIKADLDDVTELNLLDDVRHYFLDQPRTMRWMLDGTLYIQDIPPAHLPDEERWTLREQSKFRAGVVDAMKDLVVEWLAENE